jgi:hypothetical protein
MSYEFDGYSVRPIKAEDRAYLEILIESDPYHKDRMTPDFFLNPGTGSDAWALEDADGKVIFYFRTSTVVRMAIQFCGSSTAEEKRRNRSALIRGLHWIESQFRRNRFTEVIFDTEGPELAAFSRRHLGFTPLQILSKGISYEHLAVALDRLSAAAERVN